MEVQPFNNRQLNRDLLVVCQRVNELLPGLPDGRLLILRVSSSPLAETLLCSLERFVRTTTL